MNQTYFTSWEFFVEFKGVASFTGVVEALKGWAFYPLVFIYCYIRCCCAWCHLSFGCLDITAIICRRCICAHHIETLREFTLILLCHSIHLCLYLSTRCIFFNLLIFGWKGLLLYLFCLFIVTFVNYFLNGFYNSAE